MQLSSSAVCFLHSSAALEVTWGESFHHSSFALPTSFCALFLCKENDRLGFRLLTSCHILWFIFLTNPQISGRWIRDWVAPTEGNCVPLLSRTVRPPNPVTCFSSQDSKAAKKHQKTKTMFHNLLPTCVLLRFLLRNKRKKWFLMFFIEILPETGASSGPRPHARLV